MKRLVTTLVLAIALASLQCLAPAPALALYTIDYGDTISITVKDAPQFSAGVVIRPDGAITLPYIGELEVTGLTPAQLRDKLVPIFARYLRNPEVTVAVTGFRPRPVTVIGEVQNPGIKFITRANPTIFDVLAECGGFTDRAVRHEVVLIRGNGASAKRTIINVEEMLRTGDFSANIPIEQGDRVQVREVWYPNLREWTGTAMTVAAFFTAIGTLVILYDRASRE